MPCGTAGLGGLRAGPPPSLNIFFPPPCHQGTPLPSVQPRPNVASCHSPAEAGWCSQGWGSQDGGCSTLFTPFLLPARSCLGALVTLLCNWEGG